MRERKKGHIINISSAGCQSNVHITTVYMPLVRTPMIAPTKAYDYLPVMSPERAAQMVLKSLVTKQKKVTTPLGSLAEIVYDISPSSATTIMNLSYQFEEKLHQRRVKAKAA